MSVMNSSVFSVCRLSTSTFLYVYLFIKIHDIISPIIEGNEIRRTLCSFLKWGGVNGMR